MQSSSTEGEEWKETEHSSGLRVPVSKNKVRGMREQDIWDLALASAHICTLTTYTLISSYTHKLNYNADAGVAGAGGVQRHSLCKIEEDPEVSAQSCPPSYWELNKKSFTKS